VGQRVIKRNKKKLNIQLRFSYIQIRDKLRFS